jgi:GDP-L-fucose synthase
MFRGKKILVTGGTGLIGAPLVKKLIENEGAKVRVVSLDDPSRCHPDAEFMRLDLRELSQCLEACKGQEIIFHLAGIKGSPAMCAQKPASFFYPTISFNTNMLEAARQSGASHYLFTSSVGVYGPAEVFREDDVWTTFPSENDKFAGWAKRMGELQIEAYRKEYNWNNTFIVRPANVYGPLDNFSSDNAMVIPSLIRKFHESKDTVSCWGDGSPIRDFIFSEDVAEGMLQVMRSGTQLPVNLGSGTGVTIRELAETVSSLMGNKKIEWDISKPAGDKKRLMDMTRAHSIGFSPSTDLRTGLQKTIQWFLANQTELDKRYNVFL